MNFLNGSPSRGTQLVTIALVTMGMLSTTQASAETIFSMNGVDVDSTVVDLYFNSRLGGADTAATPEQRIALMTELRNIYVLATDPSSAKHMEDPAVTAQIELQKQSILFQTAANAFYEDVEVTDEQMQAEYQEQLTLYPPLDYKARHILVESQGAATEIVSLLNNGGNFEALAKEKSTGPSAPNGGDLDWFSPTQMVPEFSRAVETLEDGQFTNEPVQTQFGWHIILREDSRASTPPPFDSTTEEIRTKISNDMFQAHLNRLTEGAQ
jgi:peptidyl-prolyl cis-trans isomerase C